MKSPGICHSYAIRSRENVHWPNGKILSLKISNEDFEWQELIQEKKAPISNASLVGNKLVINYLVDTLSRVEFYDLQGNFIKLLPFEGEGTLTGFNGRLENEISYFEFSGKKWSLAARVSVGDLRKKNHQIFSNLCWNLKLNEKNPAICEFMNNFKQKL